ncbi:MAG TPA: hypothetical protein VGS98_16875 [Thermoanaerobaculia bacterium]|jgi:hypothetical protein|nr:hypothetical protein [Thermoanaerobaculia bacterium]
MEKRSLRVGAFAVLAILGLAGRVALISTSRGGADLGHYSVVARAISRGEGIYGTAVYNYSPVWAGVILLVDRGSRATGISFEGLMRTLLTGVDLLSVAVLWRIAAGRGKDPWKVAALFLANPVSIWTTGFQGQFDNVSLLFLLIAIRVTPGQAGNSPAGWPAILSLTLSIAAKQVTALHPILWIKRVRRPAMLLVPYAATAALFIPFLAEWRGIRDNVVGYSGVPRSYGLSELVLYDERFSLPIGIACLAAGLFTAWWLSGELDLVRSCLMVFLVVLFFAPGFGTQYAVWPLSVGVLLGGAGYFLLTATTMAWTLGSHFGIPGSGRWMGHLVWLSVAFWLLREVRPLAGRRAPAAAEKRA